MSSSSGSISTYIGSKWATVLAVIGLGHGGIPVPSASGLSGRPSLTDLIFAGDSFTAGENNGDDISTRFSTVACGLLTTALGHTVTEHNTAVGGTGNYFNSNGQYISSRVVSNVVPPATAPYAPAFWAAVIQASINNLNRTALNADPTVVSKQLGISIRRLRAAGRYDVINNSALFSHTGSISGDRATGNATLTLTTPSDFPGGVLRAYGVKFTGQGGVHTFTVDGSAAGTITNKDAVVPATYSEGWDFSLPSLSAGSHTIVSTISSVVSNEFISGFDFEDPTKLPLVVVCTAARAPGYPGGAVAITDAKVVEMNGDVTDMIAAQFPSDPSIVVDDFDSILGDVRGNFGADSIHPNATGNSLLGHTIDSTIRANY